MTVVVFRTTTPFFARYWIFLKASDGSTAMRTSHLPSGVIGAITSPPNRKLLKTEPPRCAIPSTSEPFTATPPLPAVGRKARQGNPHNHFRGRLVNEVHDRYVRSQ